ncbi:MAG: hypothetical protein IPO63_13850 [Bacteroidetes bacterium]|nr:hypothetical protein [Bacteroidota bacterium]
MKKQPCKDYICRRHFITKHLFFILLLLTGPVHEAASQNQIWQDALIENYVKDEGATIPLKFRLVELDITLLKTILKNAPLEFSENTSVEKLMIEFPMPDGRYIPFSVFESPILERPDKYPYIKTYIAIAEGATMRFDLTPFGFHAMISSSEHGTIFIDPCSSKGGNPYYVYFKKDLSCITCFISLSQRRRDEEA